MDYKVDYYRVLGVDSASEDVVIQAAYRALMRRYHPDTNSNSDAASRAQAINAAYAVLSVPASRRAYDLARAKAKSTAENPGRETPPPPPNEPKPAARKSGANGDVVPLKNGVGSFVGYGGVLALVGAGFAFYVLSAQPSSSTPTPQPLATTDDYPASDQGGDSTAFNEVFGADSADSNMASTEVPTTLANTTPPAVQFGDIESAAQRFANVFLNDGMSGARQYSAKCHQNIVKSPSWSGVDHCAAFDFAAAHIDERVSSSQWPRDSYFQFQSDNQVDKYVEAGAPAWSVSTRIAAIQRAAEGAAEETVRAALARAEARAKATDTKVDEAPAANDTLPQTDGSNSSSTSEDERGD